MRIIITSSQIITGLCLSAAAVAPVGASAQISPTSRTAIQRAGYLPQDFAAAAALNKPQHDLAWRTWTLCTVEAARRSLQTGQAARPAVMGSLRQCASTTRTLQSSLAADIGNPRAVRVIEMVQLDLRFAIEDKWAEMHPGAAIRPVPIGRRAVAAKVATAPRSIVGGSRCQGVWRGPGYVVDIFSLDDKQFSATLWPTPLKAGVPRLVEGRLSLGSTPQPGTIGTVQRGSASVDFAPFGRIALSCDETGAIDSYGQALPPVPQQEWASYTTDQTVEETLADGKQVDLPGGWTLESFADRTCLAKPPLISGKPSWLLLSRKEGETWLTLFSQRLAPPARPSEVTRQLVIDGEPMAIQTPHRFMFSAVGGVAAFSTVLDAEEDAPMRGASLLRLKASADPYSPNSPRDEVYPLPRGVGDVLDILQQCAETGTAGGVR